MTNVVSLARVSTEDQAGNNGEGLERQRVDIEFIINSHRLNCIKNFELSNVSGANVEETSEIKEIISLMSNRSISGVVVSSIDRLTRLINFRNFALLQEFVDNNCLIYTRESVIDLRTDYGFIMGGMQSLFAGNELRKIKQRIQDGKEVKRKQGKCPNSHITLPQGVKYDRDKNIYHYDGNVSERIKYLFELFDDNKIYNYNELAKLTGFSNVGVKNILQNKIYIGIREYTQKRGTEKYQSKNGRQADRKKIKRNENEIIKIKVIDTPLIEEDKFYRVQNIINNKNNIYTDKINSNHESFTYRGFLVCKYCGNILYTSANSKKYNKNYYVCKSKKHKEYAEKSNIKCESGYYNSKDIDYSIDKLILEIISSREYINEILNFNTSNDDYNHRLNELNENKNKLKEYKKQSRKIIDLFSLDIIDKDELLKKANDIKIDINILNNKIEQIERSNSLDRENVYKEMFTYLQHSLFDYEYWNNEDKRSLLKLTVPNFTISKDGVTEFEFFFSHKQTRTDRDSSPRPA